MIQAFALTFAPVGTVQTVGAASATLRPTVEYTDSSPRQGFYPAVAQQKQYRGTKSILLLLVSATLLLILLDFLVVIG